MLTWGIIFAKNCSQNWNSGCSSLFCTNSTSASFFRWRSFKIFTTFNNFVLIFVESCNSSALKIPSRCWRCWNSSVTNASRCRHSMRRSGKYEGIPINYQRKLTLEYYAMQLAIRLNLINGCKSEQGAHYCIFFWRVLADLQQNRSSRPSRRSSERSGIANDHRLMVEFPPKWRWQVFLQLVRRIKNYQNCSTGFSSTRYRRTKTL